MGTTHTAAPRKNLPTELAQSPPTVPMDASIDTFGLIVTCGSAIVGTVYLKPEWPIAYVIGGSIAAFFVLMAIVPGRKPGSKKKKAS